MKGLPAGWTFLSTIENFDQISTTNKKIKTQDCLETGKYPVIDQGQASISGYINDFDKVIEVDEPVIIFGDHTRAVKWVEIDFVPGADGTKVLKAKPYLNGRFSYYQLKSLEIPEKGYSRHFKFLKEISFYIPPLNEQIRIADKLDSVLAKVDAAQARLEKIPTLLKRFRQAVLAAATSGELTREWRETSETRNDFLTWKFSNIPGSWKIKLLPEVSEARLGKMLDKNKNQGVPTRYLGNINVRWGRFDLDDLKEILISEKERGELKIQDGDLLLCEGGEPGRGAVWKGEKCDLTFQKALHRVRFGGNVLPEFALFCIENDYFQNRLSLLYTGTTIKHLTGKALKKYPIPVPPVDEQKEIIRRVESLFALAGAVEKQYLETKKRTDRLTQSLLAKAFRGELVPQDPNDEPAAELLKRIQAERNAQPPVKNKRKQQA